MNVSNVQYLTDRVARPPSGRQFTRSFLEFKGR